MEQTERKMTHGIETARRLIADEREKRTGFLDLGNLRLTEVPVELFELTHVHSLNLGTWYVDEHGEHRTSANNDADAANALHTLPRDFSALGKLAVLSLAGNPVSDLGPLQTLTALQSLTCSDTQVSDLGPLQGLTALQSLTCSDTQVSDFGPLQGLTALQSLTCSDTQVSDLGPLVGLRSLGRNYKQAAVGSKTSRVRCSFRKTSVNFSCTRRTFPEFRPSFCQPMDTSSCLEGTAESCVRRRLRRGGGARGQAGGARQRPRG